MSTPNVTRLSRRDKPRLSLSPTVAHVVSLVLAYIGLWTLLLGTWFHGDDFEFLANRVGSRPSMDIWAAHVEHWSTGPILIWQVLYHVFGISSAAPFFAASLLMHVLAGHLLWRVMLRAGVRPWTATGLTTTFLVMGAGWDNITWAFQVGFIGSMALGLGAVLLLLDRSPTRFIVAVVVSVASLTFSGISITFVAAAVLALALQRRWWGAAVFGAVNGLVYAVWYLLNRASIQPPQHTLGLVDRLSNAPRWGWQLLASSYETWSSIVGTGAVTAVALVLFFAWRTAEDPTWWRSPLDNQYRNCQVALVSITGTALLQASIFAVNRNDISTPDTSRYLYFIVALSLPLIGVALDALGRSTTRRALAAGFICYVVAQQGLLLLAQERQYESPQLQADVQGLAALIAQGEPVNDVALAVDVNTRSITKWVEEGSLGSLEEVSAQEVLDARAIAQVATFPSAPDNAAAAQPVVDGVTVEPGGCAVAAEEPGSVAATVDLTAAQTFSVTADDSTSVVYRLLADDGASRTVGVQVPVNGTRWFTVTEPATLQIITDAGQDLTICAR